MSAPLHPVTVFALMWVASVVPGPGDALVVVAALREGWRGSARVIAGILLGDLLFVATAVLGWFSVSARYPEATSALRMTAMGYLLFLAWNGFRAEEKGADIPVASPGVATGFMVTLADPTAIAFYAAVLPWGTGGRPVSLTDAGVLMACAGSAILLVKLVYTALALRLRRFPVHPRARIRIRKAASILLAAAALFGVIKEMSP